jgi:hypothetical protein
VNDGDEIMHLLPLEACIVAKQLRGFIMNLIMSPHCGFELLSLYYLFQVRKLIISKLGNLNLYVLC